MDLARPENLQSRPLPPYESTLVIGERPAFSQTDIAVQVDEDGAKIEIRLTESELSLIFDIPDPMIKHTSETTKSKNWIGYITEQAMTHFCRGLCHQMGIPHDEQMNLDFRIAASRYLTLEFCQVRMIWTADNEELDHLRELIVDAAE